ncbi:MAG: hypothetical protein ACRDKV_04640, partial [Solirubrobacterales bacterium]
MRRPFRFAIALAVLGSAVLAAAAIGASIPIYTNNMSSGGARSQIDRLGKGRCKQGGGRALRVAVGKRTRECQLRTPVVGSNLDIKVTARLLDGTPPGIQRKVFVAVGVRDGNDGQYQLAVFPRRGRFQLRRDVPPDGDRALLAKGRARAVKGVGKANKLRLRAFPANAGGMRVKAWVNGRKVASVLE